MVAHFSGVTRQDDLNALDGNFPCMYIITGVTEIGNMSKWLLTIESLLQIF